MNLKEAINSGLNFRLKGTKDWISNISNGYITATLDELLSDNWEIQPNPISLTFDDWSHIVNRLPAKYYINNPSAWEDGFSQQGSDLIKAALSELSIALFDKDVIKVYK
jgi:hypothetical protein